MFALDARSGRLKWVRPRKGLTSVVGRLDNLLVLAGRRVVGLDLSSGELLWEASTGRVLTMGQGCIAAGVAYVPVRAFQDGKVSDRILKVATATGKLQPAIELELNRHEIGNLMIADGKLIILGEKGKLVIAEASPEGFKELASAEILTGKCWTYPVLANGRIYARNAAGQLVCVDVSG